VWAAEGAEAQPDKEVLQVYKVRKVLPAFAGLRDWSAQLVFAGQRDLALQDLSVLLVLQVLRAPKGTRVTKETEAIRVFKALPDLTDPKVPQVRQGLPGIQGLSALKDPQGLVVLRA
jgi:hypothetical protein